MPAGAAAGLARRQDVLARCRAGVTPPPDTAPMIGRRRLLRTGIALASGAASLGVPFAARAAGGADRPRFGLGVASGHPRADGVVLWTRLTGAGLPERAEVRWEVAHDEAFERIAARGTETAEAAWAHSVHAEPAGLEPGRWYWYRFEALGRRSPSGRTRTAPAPDAAATLDFAIASCQRYDMGHYAAWRQVAADAPDLVLFLGDYIYEYPSRDDAPRRHEGGLVTTLEQYRARYATYKSDPLLQAAHAAAPWVTVWDDHEVDNDYAGLQGQALQPDFAVQRAAAYRACWEHQPFPKSARPNLAAPGAEMRIHGRLDWGRLARVHWLDNRQYRDPQACPRPGRGGSAVVPLHACPDLLDPKRTLLGAAQERWLADGWDLQRPWNLVAQQTLMARFAWGGTGDDAAYWTDGWDGYAASRRRLLGTVADKRVPGVVVLGGDVHTHYVADLKVDFDDAKAPAIASEFCGTSISSRSSLTPERVEAALRLNPHLHYGRADRRGYVRFRLDAKQLRAELMAVEDVLDPASPVGVLARFVVDAARPGPQPA
jgi:alkaline phosphatase D